MSPAHGGSVSERQVCERSSLTEMCEPGDSVMVDKGFNVQDLFLKVHCFRLVFLPSSRQTDYQDVQL